MSQLKKMQRASRRRKATVELRSVADVLEALVARFFESNGKLRETPEPVAPGGEHAQPRLDHVLPLVASRLRGIATEL